MGTTPGMVRDYNYIIDVLTKNLIRNLWNDDNLRKFAQKFLRKTIRRGTRPIVGIGLGESKEGIKILHILSTVDPEHLLMQDILSSEGLEDVRFMVTNTGPISAASKSKLDKKAQGGDDPVPIRNHFTTGSAFPTANPGVTVILGHSAEDEAMPFFIFWLLVFNFGAPRANQKPGIKVVVRHTSNDHISEFTTYTMPDRRRAESRNSISFRNSNGTIQVGDPVPDVTIVRCDLVQVFELNTKKQEYAVTVYPPVPTSTIPVEPVVDDTKLTTVRAELTTVDTGERKQIFGHTARHVISTMKQSYPDAPNTEPEEYVTDGWYIDLDQGISCAPKRTEQIQGHGYGYFGAGGRWMPVYKTENVEIGPREKGFALKEVQSRKVYGHARVSGSAYELEVTELFEGPLDPALFEVPADFKRVEHVH